MSEYIIRWDGIGAQMTDMLNANVPLYLWSKRIRKERLREPIVRCKDCAWRRDWTVKESAEFDDALYAEGWCKFFRFGVNDDGFCKWGERGHE